MDFMSKEGYNYLYIHYSSPQLDEAYGDIFSPGVNEMTLYELSDGGFKLVD